MESPNKLKSKVSSKGWVVIPALLRKRFGIKPGTSIEFQEIDEKIFLIPENEDPVDAFFGKLPGKKSLTEALLEDRVKEMRREEARVRTG